MTDFLLCASLAKRCAGWLGGAVLALTPLLSEAQVSLTGTSSPVSNTQSFDALISSGSGTFTDNSTIVGVYGDNAKTTTTSGGNTTTAIVAGTGSASGGSLYSFGVAGTNTNADRAFGSVGSGTTGGYAYGVLFQNNTGSSITSFTVTYTGEQWRDGGANAAQVMDFSYQVATSVPGLAPSSATLASGTTTAPTPTGYTAVPGLNFSSPIISGKATPLDGNAAANRQTLTATITATVAPGSYVMLRWGDPDHNGADDGLAIDDVTASFTLVPPPATATLNVNPGSLSGFNTVSGTASAAQTYTLSGSNLTNSVTVTPPAGYAISLDGGTTYNTTAQTVTAAAAAAGQTVYVRLTGGTPASSPSIANSSAGATTVSVSLSGTVVSRPTGTPAVSVGTTTYNSAPLALTAASDGSNLLVVVRPAGTTATAPTDQTTYTGSASYGAGTALGSGYVVFAAANASSLTVTGLTASTSYAVDVYTYNTGTAGGYELYGSNSATASFTTPVQPPAPAGQLLLEENFDYASGTQLASSTSTSTVSPTTGWYLTSTSGATTNIITTSTGNLNTTSQQYPMGVLMAAPAGTSTQVALANNGQDVYKPFSQPGGATSVYAAALVTVSAAQTGDYFLHFISNASAASPSTTFQGRVYVQAVSGSTTTFNVGLSVGSTGTTSTSEKAAYGTTAYNFGTTYLLVLKYATSGGTDAVTLYLLDPTNVPLAEPDNAAVGPKSFGSTALQSTLNAVGLRQGSASSAPTLTLDALRVGSGWGTAVGRPVFTSGTANTIMAGDYYGLTISNTGTVVATSSGTAATAGTSGAVVLEKRLNLDGGILNVPAVTATLPFPLLLRARNLVGDGFQVLANGGASYVNGPVSREAVGGPSLMFPVGRNGNYRPLVLNITTAASGTTVYTGVQTDASAYSADATVNAPLIRVSQVRYFSITPSPVPAAGVFSGTLALSFGSDDVVTDPSATTFVVAKSDGAGWNSIGRTDNSSSTLTSDIFNDFSNFALASTNANVQVNPLPVSLLAFTAGRSGGGVALRWATASEQQSRDFVVERSLDGRTFVPVALVAAAGTSLTVRSYSALDATAPATTLYYRLHQRDLDGSSAYSAVVSVGGSAPGAAYPNPTTDRLTVPGAAGQPVTVRDVLGRPVRQTTLDESGQFSLDGLPTGTYLLQVPGLRAQRIQKY